MTMEALLNTFGVASLVTIVVVWWQFLQWNRRYKDQHSENGKKALPPGSMGWPFVGETLHFLALGAEFYGRKFAQFGNIYKTHLLGSPTIRVAGAEIIHELMSREPKGLVVRWPRSNRELLGANSLTVALGEEHSRLKKIMNSVFQPARLSDYLPIVQEHVRSNLLSWCQKGQMLGMPACEDMVTDILTEVLLGFGKDNDNGRKVRKAMGVINKSFFCVPFKIPGGQFKKAMDARKVITDFVKDRLQGTGDKDHVCMLDIFMAHHGTPDGMTDQQLLDNAATLLIAGTGTTSASLCLCLLLLGKHPEVVQKIRDEMTEFGLLGEGTEDTLNYDILQQLTYVQCVEKEVLRILPPVGGAFRKTLVDIETEDYLMPKDWTVIYSIRDTHRTTEVFEDRETFKPDRWLDPDVKKHLRADDSCNYIPFGAGPRVCVGKQLAKLVMHVFLVELVRLVEWEIHNPNPTIVFLPVTMPKDLLPVTFKAMT